LEWEDLEYGYGSHCCSLEHGKAEVREPDFEHIDEVVVLEEEVSLDPIVDLARVICEVEVDIGEEVRAREHGGDTARRVQEIQLDNVMAEQEMPLYNEKVARVTELCNGREVLEMELCSERAALVSELCIVKEEQEMVLDDLCMVLAIQL
jgi:hypothetical protein